MTVGQHVVGVRTWECAGSIWHDSPIVETLITRIVSVLDLTVVSTRRVCNVHTPSCIHWSGMHLHAGPHSSSPRDPMALISKFSALGAKQGRNHTQFYIMNGASNKVVCVPRIPKLEHSNGTWTMPRGRMQGAGLSKIMTIIMQGRDSEPPFGVNQCRGIVIIPHVPRDFVWGERTLHGRTFASRSVEAPFGTMRPSIAGPR